MVVTTRVRLDRISSSTRNAALSPEDYGVIAERLAVAEASLPREAVRVTRA